MDWQIYVSKIAIEEHILRELEMMESDEQRWRIILQHQLSVEDPPLSLLSDIASIILDMNYKSLANDVKEYIKGRFMNLRLSQQYIEGIREICFRAFALILMIAMLYDRMNLSFCLSQILLLMQAW